MEDEIDVFPVRNFLKLHLLAQLPREAEILDDLPPAVIFLSVHKQDSGRESELIR